MKNALFDIIGQTEEKYIARSEKRFKPRKGGEITAQVLRIVGTAASVILIISFTVFMWIVAEKHRDPVKPADSGSVSETNVTGEAETREHTTVPVETEAPTEAVTDKTTELADTEPAEDDDTAKAAALLKLLSEGGYTEQIWGDLLSLGDAAFEHLAGRKQCSKEEVTVISVYFGELLKEETANSGDVSLCGVTFPTVSALQKQPVDTGYYQAFSTYLSYAKKYAKYHRRDDMAARMPVTFRLLALYGFTDYYFDVEVDDYDYCADMIMAIKDQQERSEARRRFFSARSDEITDRFYNGRDTEQNEERKAFTDSLFISKFREDLRIYPYIGEEHDEFRYAYGASNVTYEEFVELIKKDASELYEVELSEYKPSVKRFLDYIGFDGYKKDPDIAMRSFLAIKSSIEFYNVVVEGYMPHRLEWLYDVKTPDTAPEDAFYEYFEQYLPSDVVRNFVKNSEAFYNEDGTFVCGIGNALAWISAEYKHARVVSEKNGVTTLSVTVEFMEGMSSFPREMTYDVIEDENGVRIVGGSFVDQILKPYIGAAHEISGVLNLYFKLREGQVGPEYQDNADGIFNSYDEVTDYYKDVIKTDTEFPVCYYYPRLQIYKNEIYAKLYESNPVFDGILIYPGKAAHKTEPAFEYVRTTYAFGDEELKTVSPYDVMRAMKVIEYTKDSITVMLDFIREENGKKENVTYTFVLSCDNSGASHYSYCYTLTGGTFVTECIYENTGTAVNADLVKIYINEKPTGMKAEKVKDGEYMIPFASLMQYISRFVRWESAAVCTFFYADKEYYIDVINRTAGPADNRNADYITLPPGSDYGYAPYRTEGCELYVEANIVFCFFKIVLKDLESDLTHFEEYGDGINIYVAVEDFSFAANM